MSGLGCDRTHGRSGSAQIETNKFQSTLPEGSDRRHQQICGASLRRRVERPHHDTSQVVHLLKIPDFSSVTSDEWKSRSPQGECGLKFLDRLVKRSVPGSLSLRRAWIEIGVCSVPATAWMSLSLFMSSVLRTCGDDSACAGLLVSMTIRGGENEFMGTRAESQMRRTPYAAHITIPARRVGHEFPDRRCRGPFPDIRNT